jgi:hypothetical protein
VQRAQNQNEKSSAAAKRRAPRVLRGPWRLRPGSWEAFQLRLAEALSILEDEQYLLLCHKTSPAFVQFASFGHGGMRAEAVSNTSLKDGEKLDEGQLQKLEELGWLGPTVSVAEAAAAGHRDGGGTPNHFRDWPHPAPFAEVAAFAVATLRDVLGVQTPARLCYRARNRRRERILLPALRINPMRETPEESQGRTAGLVWPRNRGELQQAVIAALREPTGNPDLEPDEDGDIAIRFGGALVFVRVNRERPAIDLFSHVVRNVEPTPALLEALNELNRAHCRTTFLATDSTVIATLEIDCDPFSPTILVRSVGYLGHLVDEVDEDLSARFGGKTAFDDGHAQGASAACERPN